MNMEISDDGKRARIRLDQTINAEELSDLISQLAELRANMLPPVSETRPNPVTQGGTQVTIEDSPEMLAVRLKDGRTRIWARSAGFGWMAFNLELIAAQALRDWFAANVDGASDLFGNSGPNAH